MKHTLVRKREYTPKCRHRILRLDVHMILYLLLQLFLVIKQSIIINVIKSVDLDLFGTGLSYVVGGEKFIISWRTVS